MASNSLCVTPTQFGDLIFLSSSHQFLTVFLDRFQLLPQALVPCLLHSVFQLLPAHGPTSPTAGAIGMPVKLGSEFRLKEVVGGRWVAAIQDGFEFSLGVGGEEGANFKVENGDGVDWGRAVSVALSTSGPTLLLRKDLRFAGLSDDLFQLIKFSSNLSSTEVQFGRLCQFYTTAKMFLTVFPTLKPGLSQSKTDQNLSVGLSTNPQDGNSYWVIENTNRMTGGTVVSTCAFVIYHVATGLYITPEMTLGPATSAGKFSFQNMRGLVTESIRYSEFSPLLVDSNLVGISAEPTKTAVWTDVFKPVIHYIGAGTDMRYDLQRCSNTPLRFEVHGIDMMESETVLRVASLRKLISHLESKRESGVSPEIGRLFRSDNEGESRKEADLASDFDIVNQMIRIHIGYETEPTHIGFRTLVSEKLHQVLTRSTYATQKLFENKEILSDFIHQNPAAMAEILASADLSAVASFDLMFTAELFLSLQLKRENIEEYSEIYRLFAIILASTSKSLEIADDFLHFSDLGTCEYVLRFIPESPQLTVSLFGNTLQLIAISNAEIQSLIQHCLQIAVHVCGSKSREKIIREMGLETNTFVEILHSEMHWLKTSAALFLAEVSIPTALPRKSLASIMKSKLVTIDDLSERSSTVFGWLSTASEPLSDLIKREVFFWFLSNHSSSTDVNQLWDEVATHIDLMRRLIDFRIVGDLLAGAMEYCIVAIAEILLGRKVEGFSDRFPMSGIDGLRVKAGLTAVVNFLIGCTQWKKLRTAQELHKSGVTTLDSGTVNSAMHQIWISTQFASFCHQSGIEITAKSEKSVKSNSQPLLSQYDTYVPELCRIVNSMMGSISIRKFLLELVTETVSIVSDIQSVLSLLDFELDTERAIMQFLSEIGDYSSFLKEISIETAIHQARINLYSFRTSPNSEISNITEYTTVLSSLKAFIQNLDAHNYQKFEKHLRRTDFHIEMQRMWAFAELPLNHVESQTCENLRRLIIDLNRSHCRNWKEALRRAISVLRFDSFLCEYPEYILMLQEMNLLYKDKESTLRMLKYLFKSASKGKNYKEICALAQFVSGDSFLSLHISYVSQCFEQRKSEVLTVREAQILDVINKICVSTGKISPFLQLIDKSQFEAKNINYLSLILTQKRTIETSLDIFAEICDDLMRKNDDQIIADKLFEYMEIANSQHRFVHYSFLSDPIIHLFDVIFRQYYGILSLMDTNFAKISSETILKTIVSLSKVLTKFSETTAYPSAYLSRIQSLLKSLLVATAIDISTNTVILQAISMSFSHPPAEVDLKRYEIADFRLIFSNNFQQNSERPFIQHLAQSYSLNYSGLSAVFPTHPLSRDYLLVCKRISDSISENFQVISIYSLAEDLISYIISARYEENVALALSILTSFVEKLPEFRDHLLQCLKANRRHIPFFSVFSDEVSKFSVQISTKNSDISMRKSNPDFSRSTISEFLRFFQACCDGCIYSFQIFLHCQDDRETYNINIAQIVSSLLCDILTSFSNANTLENTNLALRCAVTILEMTSGPCKFTQLDVCKKSNMVEAIVKSMNEVEAMHENSIPKELQHAVVKLMIALVEGREHNHCLLAEIFGEIDLKVFLRVGVSLSQSFSKSTLMSLNLETLQNDDIKATFILALDLIRLCYVTMSETDLEPLRGNPLMQYLSTIEIERNYPDGSREIRSFIFQIPYKTKFLTGRTARQVLFDANRQSRQEKLHDFVNKIEICRVEMEYQQALARHFLLKSITKHWHAYRMASFCLVVVINLILLLTVTVADATRLSISETWHTPIAVLQLFQIAMISLGTASYFTEYFHFFYYPLKSSQKNAAVNVSSEADFGSLSMIYSLKRPQAARTLDSHEALKAGYELAYVFCSFAAVLYPSINPVLLLQIAHLNDAVINILKSITKRWSQLALTFIFSLVAIYLFSFFAYIYFYEYYDENDGLYCETLLDCFFSTLNFGLRSGGGLGDALGPSKESEIWRRMLFDIFFFVLITTILMAMVFGIIIDTFSQLRDEQSDRDWDMENVCFICGKKRSLIDLKGEGWLQHLMKVHNAYSYMYFLIYLQELAEKDCSGAEKMVKEMVERKDIAFFPTTSRKMGFGIEESGKKEEEEGQF